MPTNSGRTLAEGSRRSAITLSRRVTLKQHPAEEGPVDVVQHAELLRRLVEVHGRTVRAVVARIELDREAVSDAWAQVFEVAYSRITSLEDLAPEQQRAWLVGCARRVALNQGRRNGARRRAMQRLIREPLVVELSPEELYVLDESTGEDSALISVVMGAFGDLAPQHRRVLGLHALGYKGPRIAAELGVTPEAARARLARAKASLRSLYNNRVTDSSEQGSQA